MSSNNYIANLVINQFPHLGSIIKSLLKNNENKRIEEVIIETNTLSEKEMLSLLSKEFGFQLFENKRMKFDGIHGVTNSFVQLHGIIPIEINTDFAQIATNKPFSHHLHQKILFLGISSYELILVTKLEYKWLTQRIFNGERTKQLIKNLKENSFQDEVGSNELDIEQAPIVQLVDSLIQEAIFQGSSDLHIEPQGDSVIVRMRIDGLLVEYSSFPSFIYKAVLTRIKILAKLDITKHSNPQDGRIRFSYEENVYDCRVATLPVSYGEKIVIRILDQERFSLNRFELGFSNENNDKITKMLAATYGLILITGPTGCGKTTTLYSFLRELNDKTKNIVTVEDPIEYSLKGINQVQVNPMINLTFASALRSILRQDPDILMIGEIRDEETAQIAIRSAITGHLVLATLHTHSAISAISRLVDMGIQHFMLSEALIGIVSQQLVRKLCPHCKEKRKITPFEKELLPNKDFIYDSKGCIACQMRGYSGRMAISEVLVIDDQIKKMLHQKKTIDEIEDYTKSLGLKNIQTSCIEAIERGDTTTAELIRVGIKI